MTNLARSVNPALSTLRDRLHEVRARMSRAAERSGRDPAAVALVGVVKTVPSAVVREAVALGLMDLGENRVQEAQVKVGEVGRRAARWHMVGHLQRNKAGRALELFDRIHSLDRMELAESLSRMAVAAARRLPVMLEVNVSGEASKHGLAPDDLLRLLEPAAALPGLEVDGLMTVGAPVDEPERARSGFDLLRRLRDRAQDALGLRLPHLSMGMSGDFEVAIEEGSTMVRVGTALFGPRA